jgi:hypothetical protein
MKASGATTKGEKLHKLHRESEDCSAECEKRRAEGGDLGAAAVAGAGSGVDRYRRVHESRQDAVVPPTETSNTMPRAVSILRVSIISTPNWQRRSCNHRRPCMVQDVNRQPPPTSWNRYYHPGCLEIVALYPHRRHMTAKARAFIGRYERRPVARLAQ